MDIIKLAKKVELLSQRAGVEMVIGGENQLKEFANLVLEEAAKKCDEEKKIYSSKRYTTDPLGGYRERFAAGRCAEEIRNMKSKEE